MQKQSIHINYKIPIIAFVVICILAGAYSFFHIPTNLYPNVSFPKIKIIIHSGQESVDKIMATITIPLESIINQSEGVETIQSKTISGACEISAFLKWDANVAQVKHDIEASVSNFVSSTGMSLNVQVEKITPSLFPVACYAIEGMSDPIALTKIAEFQIKPILSEIPGVQEVSILGGKQKEYRIEIKPERLSELEISLAQIQSAILQENIYQSNGIIRDHDRMYISVINNEIQNTEELKKLVILNSANRLIQLKDIANMYLAEVKEYSSIHANGNQTPILQIGKHPDANLILLQQEIDHKIQYAKSILPKTIQLTPLYKQADFELESLKDMQYALWVGLIASFIITLLFLRSISATAAVYISIPFTMTLSLLVLYLLHYSFNLMTLGAIAASIGLMLDDAILVVEQIHKSREEHPEKSIAENIQYAIKYLLPALITSSLTSIIIFVPYLVMSGSAGAYFKVLANTMAICLSCSFFVSWWITPILFLLFHRKKKNSKPFIAASTNWIQAILKTPMLAFGILSLCILLIIILPSKLQTGFLPTMDEGAILIDYESPSGTDVIETNNMLQKLSKHIHSLPDIKSSIIRVGTRTGFHISEVNRGDILIQLKRDRHRSTAEITDSIRHWVKCHLPMLQTEFGQPLQNTMGDAMQSKQPIELKLYGEDQQQLEILSNRISTQLAELPGVVDVYNGVVKTSPTISIKPNVPLLAQLGLNPSEFQFQVQTQTEGFIICTVIDKDQQLNVRMVYPTTYKNDIHSLQNAMISLPGGVLKPISALASTSLISGEAEVYRENQQRMIVITARLKERDLGIVSKAIQEKILQSINLPSGYHLTFGGEYAKQQQSFRELLFIFLIGLCGVFIIVLFLFRKLYVAFTASLLSVLGIAGSFLLLFATDTPLNIASYTGIIIVSGIIAENVIFSNLLFLESLKQSTFVESIAYAAASRMRPKIMVVLSSIITLLPLAFDFNNSGLAFQPLAIAIIGGMLFALPLLLIVWPSMQMYFGRYAYKNEMNVEAKTDPIK